MKIVVFYFISFIFGTGIKYGWFTINFGLFNWLEFGHCLICFFKFIKHLGYVFFTIKSCNIFIEYVLSFLIESLLKHTIEMFDGFQFYENGSPQKRQAIFKNWSINLVKLIFHHVQVLDREGKEITTVLALNGKLSLKWRLVLYPIVHIELKLIMPIYKTGNDTRDPKVIALGKS